MKELAKARWDVDDKTIHLGMEFSKVDKSRRMVAGWATLDNVDTENDVVTSEASIDAFSRSRRNLREMHKADSAVGRIVSFKEDTFRAPDGKTYNGIFVKVRVSEGAETTWLKVLDGTLNGFSIGGAIVEEEEVFSKDANTNIRKITKYDLNELSLVDNPGNQYSDITNVFKFKKSADGSVTALSGMVEEHQVLNVFFCKEDEITQEKPDESSTCPVCSEFMDTIGFIENGSDRDKKVNALVTKYRGGENMTIKKSVVQEGDDESVATGNEEGDPTEVPTPARREGDDVEEVEEPGTDEVEEVQDEGEEISKKIDSLKNDISDILSKNTKDTSEKIEALEKVVTETHEFLDKKIEGLNERFTSIHNDLETTKSRQATLEASLKKINSSGAFKKSIDLESVELEQKSETLWNGAFSVDTLVR